MKPEMMVIFKFQLTSLIWCIGAANKNCSTIYWPSCVADTDILFYSCGFFFFCHTEIPHDVALVWI